MAEKRPPKKKACIHVRRRATRKNGVYIISAKTDVIEGQAAGANGRVTPVQAIRVPPGYSRSLVKKIAKYCALFLLFAAAIVIYIINTGDLG